MRDGTLGKSSSTGLEEREGRGDVKISVWVYITCSRKVLYSFVIFVYTHNVATGIKSTTKILMLIGHSLEQHCLRPSILSCYKWFQTRNYCMHVRKEGLPTEGGWLCQQREGGSTDKEGESTDREVGRVLLTEWESLSSEKGEGEGPLTDDRGRVCY